LAEAWVDALPAVTESDLTADAIQTAGEQTQQTVAVIARALIAQTLIEAEKNGVPALTGDVRDALVDRLIDELEGHSRSIGDWITAPIKGLALRYVTWKIGRKRGVYSDSIAPAGGDILLYQTRGADIRHFIRTQIENAGDELYVMAHSLGGIACVDLLVLENLPNVKGLITVGSQSPLLYELDSLTSLRYGKPLPDHFPRWLNVYDPDDFLSYIAAKLFPGKAEDFEVRSRQPFPQAHSAYWNNPKLWEKVAEFVE
jgi:hypothetical protein